RFQLQTKLLFKGGENRRAVVDGRRRRRRSSSRGNRRALARVLEIEIEFPFERRSIDDLAPKFERDTQYLGESRHRDTAGGVTVENATVGCLSSRRADAARRPLS